MGQQQQLLPTPCGQHGKGGNISNSPSLSYTKLKSHGPPGVMQKLITDSQHPSWTYCMPSPRVLCFIYSTRLMLHWCSCFVGQKTSDGEGSWPPAMSCRLFHSRGNRKALAFSLPCVLFPRSCGSHPFLTSLKVLWGQMPGKVRSRVCSLAFFFFKKKAFPPSAEWLCDCLSVSSMKSSGNTGLPASFIGARHLCGRFGIGSELKSKHMRT